ncbi:hypothetical protein P43SY_007342 [Pythium insidiosum]|uniref:subtilisin n=1 Tax=Pythium insidiosum TaxID=114742 RepID=A0AAD5M8C8_PYTIN|nr:hypothetical protein P43SY_007342 [Pythium insidiosum]
MVRVFTTLVAAAALAGACLVSPVDAGQRAYGGGRQRTNVIVTMKERPTAVHTSISTQKFSSRGGRVRALQDGLQGHATRTQARVRDLLQKAGASTHSRSTFDQIRQAFQTTTMTPGSSGYTCGTTPDSMIPNNQFGFGRIDAFKALA